MMSEREHTGLTDHIRESLQNHEEPYDDGAWESFCRYERSKDRRAKFRRILGIAASLILLLSSLFVLKDFGTAPPPEATVSGTPGINKPAGAGKRDPDSAPATFREPEVTLLAQPSVTSAREDISNEESGSAEQVTASVFTEGSGIRTKELYPQYLTGTPVNLPPGLPGKGMGENPVQAAGLASGHKFHSDRMVQKNNSGSVSIGLTYSPLMNANERRTEMNMGGGLYTEWNFAGDLSLTSGLIIAQNQLEFDDGENMHETGRENLAYLQVDLVSLEIPLSLRYTLTDHFTVSAGISSAAFLKEHYNYTYEHRMEVQVLEHREGTGFEPVTKEITIRETDHQSEPSLSAVDWAAFYTFSVGYHYEISGKHTLSLEPFIKLPSGNLTSRRLKYYTGGLQMNISF